MRHDLKCLLQLLGTMLRLERFPRRPKPRLRFIDRSGIPERRAGDGDRDGPHPEGGRTLGGVADAADRSAAPIKDLVVGGPNGAKSEHERSGCNLLCAYQA